MPGDEDDARHRDIKITHSGVWGVWFKTTVANR
jgi:hypothetical protein